MRIVLSPHEREDLQKALGAVQAHSEKNPYRLKAYDIVTAEERKVHQAEEKILRKKLRAVITPLLAGMRGMGDLETAQWLLERDTQQGD